MKLCDRCRVSGCLLNYLGSACKHARKITCPDVHPNRAELIANMTVNEMSTGLIPALLELCEDGLPSTETVQEWLLEEPKGECL